MHLDSDRRVFDVIRETATSIKTLVAALKRCGKGNDLRLGKALHHAAVEAGQHKNRYVSAALVTMYSSCGEMAVAREAFDKAEHADVVLWTSLIMGYVNNGESAAALKMFYNMNGCTPNSVTFIGALKAVSSLASEKRVDKEIWFEMGKEIHQKSRKLECASDVFLSSTLVDMYGKCGNMKHARAVFDVIPRPNVVSWNALLLGYVENKDGCAPLELFTRMGCEPDSVTFVAVFKSCISLATNNAFHTTFCLEKGIEVHKKAKERELESELFVAGVLVDMYTKCGSMLHAQTVFESLCIRDTVLWNSMMLGYVENGQVIEAMDLFTNMDCQPNAVTFVGALKACGSVGALAVGERIHLQIRELGLEEDYVLATCLVDFYRKCGCMAAAEEVFSRMHFRDMVSWNSLITGYASAGDTDKVFALVKRMQEDDVPPNDVTFLSILTACSHAGLVDEGKRYFELMLSFGITPKVEHCRCMMDMFGRAHRLEEALSLLVPYQIKFKISPYLQQMF